MEHGESDRRTLSNIIMGLITPTTGEMKLMKKLLKISVYSKI